MKTLQQSPGKHISLQELTLLFFIVVFHLWPAYGVFKVGSLPGLNLQRLCLVLLIISWIYTLLSSSWHLLYLFKRISEHRYFIFGLATYFLWKYLSIANSTNFTKSIYAATNELVPFFLLFLIGITVWHDSKQIERAIVVLMISSFFVSLLGIYESFVKHNLFQSFVPITSEFTEFALESKIRGGYRIQSTFSHPLVLAEYLVFTIPLAFVIAVNSRALFYRVLGLIVLAFSGCALLMTGSRAAVGILVLLGMLAVLWKLWLIIRSPKSSGYWLTALVMLLLPVVIAVAFLGFTLLWTKVQGHSMEEISSTTGRFTQLQMSIPLIMGHPILGYGAGNSATTLDYGHPSSLPTIDNYYLSIALDSGLPALALFIFMLGYILILSLLAYRSGAPLAQGFIFSLLGFTLFISILSITAVFPIVFLSFSMLIAMKKNPVSG